MSNLPFWIIPVGLVVIGIAGMAWIMRKEGGDYDFGTPLAALGWGGLFIMLAIGIAVGKYIF